MSPQLHHQILRLRPALLRAARARRPLPPVAFLDHGLMVAMLMAAPRPDGLLALAVAHGARLRRRRHGLDRRPPDRHHLPVPVGRRPILLAIGIASWRLTRRSGRRSWCCSWWRRRPPTATARIQGTDASRLVGYADEYLGANRVRVARRALTNEDALVAAGPGAAHRPAGAGATTPRVRDEDGRDISVVDGLWLITVGTTGLLGLITLGVFLASPRAGRSARPCHAGPGATPPSPRRSPWPSRCGCGPSTTSSTAWSRPIFPLMAGRSSPSPWPGEGRPRRGPALPVRRPSGWPAPA